MAPCDREAVPLDEFVRLLAAHRFEPEPFDNQAHDPRTGARLEWSRAPGNDL